MTEYLINSSLCMVILLAVYFFFLEKEKTYRFNRFYLLFSLAFSLLVPFIPITVYQEIESVPEIVLTNQSNVITDVDPSLVTERKTAHIDYQTPILVLLYLLGVGFFLSRFIKNLSTILKTARNNPRVVHQEAKLVLIKDSQTSHTFLNYIFINEADYQAQAIEKELLSHELTHVRQKHTLDILFVEMLYILFWFNPLLILYKKAIQLNHEFLADEEVLTVFNNVRNYQTLLLSKIGLNNSMPLANSFNYLITKKRLTMMTKHLNKTRAICKQLALIPLLAALVFTFSTKVVAQIEEKSQLSRRSQREVPLTGKAVTSLVKKAEATTKKTSRSSLPAKKESTNRNEIEIPSEQVSNSDKRVASVEVMPNFPGGIEKFKWFITDRIKADATGGSHLIAFFVEKDGTVSTALEPASNRNYFENEVLKALKESPKWTPGVQNGYAVRMTYAMKLTYTKAKNSNDVIADVVVVPILEELFLSLEKKEEQGQLKVYGTVVNSAGNPMRGTTITTKNYEHGTITDKDGRFSFNLPDPRPLIFSHIGYVSKNISL